DIIMGRGFVALAIIYFANWNPYKTLFGALGFTFVDTGQSLFIQLAGPAFQQSSFFFNMLPYIFIIALIPIFGRKARPPRYLLKPYRKG
ncbi:MAG: ABC transporter permease, partial [Nitrososphaerota archaeon]|nr:ABC transporter permease [Nitrososphaerota archaeon]